jgi:hypothetical protein
METEKWDTPSPRFSEWWDMDVYYPGNPFEKGSPAFWAWEGWQAALQYDPPTKDEK